ncbi:MAG: hypothetical protein R2690_07650 [Acidimicrobiales bacterium]
MADEDVTIHTRRGTELRAVLRRPDDADTGRLPAVVLCQGLSGVCDVVLPDIAAALATAGIVSVRFDYAGYGGSHGERGWIDPPARVVDAQHVLAWLAAAPGVDATPRRVRAQLRRADRHLDRATGGCAPSWPCRGRHRAAPCWRLPDRRGTG